MSLFENSGIRVVVSLFVVPLKASAQMTAWLGKGTVNTVYKIITNLKNSDNDPKKAHEKRLKEIKKSYPNRKIESGYTVNGKFHNYNASDEGMKNIKDELK